MRLSLGSEISKWEHRQLAHIHDIRKAHEEFNNKIRGAFHTLIQYHRDSVDYLYMSWIVRVSFAEGVMLKEECYRTLSEYFDYWPEKEFSGEGKVCYSWKTGLEHFAYFTISLARGTCRVREITTTEIVTKEEKTTRFEPVGDCSGLEA